MMMEGFAPAGAGFGAGLGAGLGAAATAAAGAENVNDITFVIGTCSDSPDEATKLICLVLPPTNVPWIALPSRRINVSALSSAVQHKASTSETSVFLMLISVLLDSYSMAGNWAAS
jgi:hypothetical protein